MDDLDPRKLRQLSDSLSELTGSVNEASESIKSMGKTQTEGSKVISRALARAAKAQQKATASEETSLKDEEALESKQKKLYEDELRWRGYKIDATGQETKTRVELTVAQRKELSQLDKRIAKERELAEVAKDPVKSFKDISTRVNSLQGVTDQLQEKLFELTGQSKLFTAGLMAGTAVVAGVTKAATSMADSLYKGERGAKVGAKALKEFNDEITKIAYGIGAALMFLPGLGIASKIAGAAVTAFGIAMQGSTKLIEMGAEYNDKVYDAFNKLSEVGLTTAQGMSGVSGTMEKLGVTSAEIEKMNSLLATNSKDLALFGGTAANGLDKFSEIAGKISHPASELNKKLMLLGVSADEQREHTLKYMALQTRMGMMQNKTQADQIKGAVAYIEELDRIAAITGIGRKEQEEAQKQVMAIEELRAAMYQAEKAGDKDRQRELEAAFKYSSRLMAEGRKKEAAGFAKYYAAGKNVIDQESAAAAQASRGAIEAIREGKQGEDVYQAGLTTARESMTRVAGTKAIGGDVSSQIGDFNATLDAFKRNEKLMAEAQKAGYGPERIDEYVKKLQAEKKEKPDPQLEKNVEAIQIQQKAGLLLDQAAKKMDGAGLAMANSVKAFNEAVQLFARANGVVSPTAPDVSKAGDVSSEASAIANASSELTEKQRQIYQKAMQEYREAVKNGTVMQKYFGVGLDDKMKAAKQRMDLASEGKLNDSQAAPTTGATPAPTPAPSTSTGAPEAAPVAPQSSNDTTPVDIPQALTGGLFKGPDTSSVMPNKTSMTASDVLTSIKQSMGKVERKAVESELPNLEMAAAAASTAKPITSKKANSLEILERFTDIMESKFDDVISAISENNNIKEEILLYSKV